MSCDLFNAALRGAAAVGLAGGAVLAFAGGARADGLPLPPPVPSLPASSLPAQTSSSAPKLLPVSADLNLPILTQAPTPPASPLPRVSGAPAPAPLVHGLRQVSVGVKGALDQVGQATAGTPLSVLDTGGAAARLATVTVDATPLATACVQATGTGTALANLDLTALGTDLGTPVQQTLPGVVSACPAGTGQGAGSGTPGTDTVATAGATAGSLVGACARLTTSLVPVESTVVVLDQDLVTSLTKAGLPLEQLIVPCPTDSKGGGAGGGSGAGTGGAGGGNGGSGGGFGSSGAGGSSSAASDVPSLGGSLPFTGAQVSLFLVLASALLASGATLVARARRAGATVARLV